MTGMTLVGTLLAVAAGGVLAGCTMGYYTARADERREQHDRAHTK